MPSTHTMKIKNIDYDRLNAAAVSAAVSRRTELRKALPDGVIVLAGRTPIERNHDCNFPFRQDSDFLFLTAFNDPDARLILHPRGEIFFIPRVTQKNLVWLGEAETTRTAKARYGFRRVCYLDAFEQELKKLAGQYALFHAGDGASGWVRKAASGARIRREPLKDALIDLRMEKNTDELKLLAHACRVTSRAHEAIMEAARPGMYEFEMLNLFEKFCADRLLPQAYPPIFAAGSNGAVMHYHRHDRKMRRGDLLLVDAGAECHGYAADITRTFPVSGRFTKFQRQVYDIVLEAEQASIAKAAPGVTVQDVQEVSEEILSRGLRELGILRGSPDQARELKTITLFLPYCIAHTLGVDVHDVTAVPGVPKKDRRAARPRLKLRPGLVLTVEPGIYFIRAYCEDKALRRKHAKVVDWAKVERHLDFGGIRIEDDIAVTASGRRVLTDACRDAAEIEQRMA